MALADRSRYEDRLERGHEYTGLQFNAYRLPTNIVDGNVWASGIGGIVYTAVAWPAAQPGLAAANPDAAVRVLGELRTIGCTVALDDIGLGQSSMSDLRRMPLDIVKVDRRLVAELGDDTDRMASVCELVVTLGHVLGLVVIAQGVEGRRQIEQLCELDCDLGQGYFFGRPMPADALEFRLKNQLLT